MTTNISRIGLTASLTLISLSSGIWLNRAIAQVGSNQPIRNPGVSGISTPASSGSGGATTNQPVTNPGVSGITSPASSGNGGATINQPVTNPGVSGGYNPTPTLSQPNSTVNGQPITNPGTSGISTPSLTQPNQPATNTGNSGTTINQPVVNPGVSGITSPASPGNGGATINQPVVNPGVSGGNNPTPTLSQPNSGVNGQPITNPGTSGISTPSLTQPNQPATNPDTIRTIVAPSQLPSATVQPRTNQNLSPRPSQSTQPLTPQTTPTPIDNGSSTGFIRTAISSQFADGPNVQRLDAQLLQATCSQNWQGAIAIVDQALGSAPTNQVYRSQLRTYRNRLETLSNARTMIPNWSQSCTRG